LSLGKSQKLQPIHITPEKSACEIWLGDGKFGVGLRANRKLTHRLAFAILDIGAIIKVSKLPSAELIICTKFFEMKILPEVLMVNP
jgi:hypothetical protein